MFYFIWADLKHKFRVKSVVSFIIMDDLKQETFKDNIFRIVSLEVEHNGSI